MSSDIQEDPNVIVNVRYNRGLREDRGERVERRVDIDDSSNTFPEHRVDLSAQDGGAHVQKHPAAVQRSLNRDVALVLGLLCLLSLLLLVAVSIVSKQFFSPDISSILEELKSNDGHKERHTSNDNLDDSFCQFQDKESQTEGNNTRWTRFRCSCYYKSTAMKNWTESKKDCESRGAHLVIIGSMDEHGFLKNLTKHGSAWIGLQSVGSWAQPHWQWVDGTKATYMGFGDDVFINPGGKNRRVYMDQQGTWQHTKNGTKQWICEKQMS